MGTFSCFLYPSRFFWGFFPCSIYILWQQGVSVQKTSSALASRSLWRWCRKKSKSCSLKMSGAETYMKYSVTLKIFIHQEFRVAHYKNEEMLPKCLKIRRKSLNFGILAFSTNFCPIKTDLSGNTVWPQASGFQKLTKMDYFWHF